MQRCRLVSAGARRPSTPMPAHLRGFDRLTCWPPAEDGLMRTVHRSRPNRRRRRRRRPGRALGRAAARGGRPPGHRARARGRARGPRRTAWRRRLPLRHRPHRADDARPHRRRIRLRRRGLADWLTLRAHRPRLPRVLPRRLAARTCTPTLTAMAEEIEPGLRRRPRPPATERYVDFVSQLYRYEMTRLHRPQHRLALRPAHPEPARLAAIGGFRRLAPEGRRSTSRTRARSGSSRSRRCTPGCRPTTRWRSTP